jgi:4-amino-4-deoxy-L-arabinose transferase-like glycosyltransferase
MKKTAKKILEYVDAHELLVLVLLFAASLTITLLLAPFNQILREDALAYLIKAREIASGNFIPILTHAMGWPIMLSLFVKNTLFNGMTTSRIISSIIGSASIIPLFLISKKLLGRRMALLASLLFVFEPILITSAYSGLTEPLFALLLLFALYFLQKSEEKGIYAAVASFFAALSYFVRLNGIFVLLAIMAFMLIKKKTRKYIPAALLIFVLVNAPNMYLRWKYFGSPFNYGANSVYTVDTIDELWYSSDSKSIFEYISGAKLSEMFSRFVIFGFVKSCYMYLFQGNSIILVPFIILGMFFSLRKKEFLPFFIILAAWIICLSPIAKAYLGDGRLFYPLIPLGLIFAVSALKKINSQALIFALILSMLLFSGNYILQEKLRSNYSIVEDGMKWGAWASENIKGKIAIIEGGDLIMINKDVNVGGTSIMDLFSEDLSVTRPKYYSKETWNVLNNEGVTHIAVDELNYNRNPLFSEIHKNPPAFLEKEYDNHNSESKWKITIYWINWEKAGKNI